MLRLVGNAVIYYNSLILSEALGEFEQRGDLASAEVLKHVSPVAWQHINVYERYQSIGRINALFTDPSSILRSSGNSQRARRRDIDLNPSLPSRENVSRRFLRIFMIPMYIA